MTDTFRAVNLLDHDVIILDGCARELVTVRHRWRNGGQIIKVTYRNALGRLELRELDPQTRYEVVRLARH